MVFIASNYLPDINLDLHIILVLLVGQIRNAVLLEHSRLFGQSDAA